jgi:hypothetical protein
MHKHQIMTAVENPATIEIAGATMTITAGGWPDFGGVAQVPGVAFDLAETDAFVYLDRDGGIVVSATFVPYGRDMAGNASPMLDLLAWHDGADWHVKELTHA